MSGYYPPQGAPPQQFGPLGQQPPPQHYPGHQPQFPPPPPPPPAQQWGPPPPGQHMPPSGPPVLQGYNLPGAPPMQHGFPPQQQPPPQFGFPPHQSPPQAGLYALPPQQPFPQQPFPQQSIGQPCLPSPGYGNDVAPGNANADVDALIKAMSGFKRDHSTIIRVLSKADPRQMALIRQTYAQRNNGSSLEAKVESSFRSHYGDILLQLVRGPLLSDVYNVNRSIKGLGTKEDMLNDVLIGRSNADMRAIKAAYQATFRKPMEADVGGDLSLKTKTMFDLIMRASRTEESYPYNPIETSRDVESIHSATRGPSVVTNQDTVFTILTQRSDNQIRAIATEYQQKHHKTLEDMISTNFSGHMKDALMLGVGRAVDRAKTDAYCLEDTMKGLGTKDDMLVNKTVRVHWDRQHMDQVKKAYRHFMKKDLVSRVKGETSGDYRDALVGCLN